MLRWSTTGMERSAAAAREKTTPRHFVLVHGSCHGAWCWYKVRHRLECSGHRVSCLDLASAGIDLADADSIHSFEDYNKPLSDFLAALPPDEKVILVGHSAGGLSVSHAIHGFGNKISLAIFVAATMLPFGFLSDEDKLNVIADLSEFGEVHEYKYGAEPDNPPTSGSWKIFPRKFLYHMSPEEDCTLASMLLRPWPCRAFETATFKGREEGITSVRRVYIKTTQDRMVKPEQQSRMIRRWPPSEVLTIEAEHSPFFSAPDELCNLILEASAST